MSLIVDSHLITHRDAKKKVVVVGDGGCGKTCMLLSYTTGRFPGKYVPTVFENYICDVRYEKKIVELALWDTAGQEEYDRLRPLSYPDTDILIICYAIDTPMSLSNVIDKWYPEVTHFCQGTPILVVGCKKDLRDDPSPTTPGLTPATMVTQAEGLEVATRIGAKHLECSAVDQIGLQNVFHAAVKACMAGHFKKMRKKVCVVM